MTKAWELPKRLLLKGIPKIKNPIWIHTASVGEFNTALPLIKHLRKVYPVLLTYSSPRAKTYLERTRDWDALYPLPLDFPLLVRKFEEEIKPKVILIFERELWPSLITFTEAPKVLLNAYARDTFLERLLVKRFSLILARTERDARVFKNLGAEKVKVCGNLKLVYEYTPRKLNLPEDNYVVAGSTHDREEEIILGAFKEVRRFAKLIIAPRHVERAKKVKSLAEHLNFKVSLLSEEKEGAEVIVVDKLGLLRDLYALGKIAIVGGTFVPVGGHNLLEPAYYNLPVVYGSYTHKVEDLKETLEELGLGFSAKNEKELGVLLKKLLLEFKRPSVDLRKVGKRVKECYLKEIHNILSEL